MIQSGSSQREDIGGCGGEREEVIEDNGQEGGQRKKVRGGGDQRSWVKVLEGGS